MQQSVPQKEDVVCVSIELQSNNIASTMLLIDQYV